MNNIVIAMVCGAIKDSHFNKDATKHNTTQTANHSWVGILSSMGSLLVFGSHHNRWILQMKFCNTAGIAFLLPCGEGDFTRTAQTNTMPLQLHETICAGNWEHFEDMQHIDAGTL